MVIKHFACNICKETEDNSDELIGLSTFDDSPVYVKVENGTTDTHICIACLKELKEFLDNGCKGYNS